MMFCRYSNPVVAPLTNALVNGLTGSPWQNLFGKMSRHGRICWTDISLAYSAHPAHRYLEQIGHQILENGWAINSNGTMMASVCGEIPQGKYRTSQPSSCSILAWSSYWWVVWLSRWFSWHSVETARYALWNPITHTYTYRMPYQTNWTNQAYADPYIGTTSYIN